MNGAPLILGLSPLVVSGLAALAALCLCTRGTKAEFAALSWLRSRVYDWLIIGVTAMQYHAVLQHLPIDCRLMDVGIGTAAALLHTSNRSLLQDKRVRVHGIDIDAHYVEAAGKAVAEAGLAASPGKDAREIDAAKKGPWVDVRKKSIYDVGDDDVGRYDAAYFSSSLMLVPDPAGALRAAARAVGPAYKGKAGADASVGDGAGIIYVSQTFEREASADEAGLFARFVKATKPFLKFLLTIDFGNATFRNDFERTVKDAGLVVAEETQLKAMMGGRSIRLFMLAPAGESGAVARS